MQAGVVKGLVSTPVRLTSFVFGASAAAAFLRALRLWHVLVLLKSPVSPSAEAVISCVVVAVSLSGDAVISLVSVSLRWPRLALRP